MTPGARVQAAIDCLDRILAGDPAEKVLTGWARGARYAGSKDRAAVRDHVYDVLRQKRACAALGGGEGARALMIGLIRLQRADPAAVFTGKGHAPSVLTAEELRTGQDAPPPQPELPDWLLPQLEARYGGDLATALAPLARRANVFLRVNLRKADRQGAMAALAEEEIPAEPAELAPTALKVTAGARRISQSRAYREGLVELQDAASQAAMETLPLRDGMTVLDYCAGGGGKTLALAGRARATYYAHDANPQRMRDLPARSARAGVTVRQLATEELAGQGPYDLVLCDVPCSGSGTWARDPDAKWRLTPERLAALNTIQDEILDAAAALVAEGGLLAYTTCSLLAVENEGRIAAFLARHPDWTCCFSRQWHLYDGGDGFFVAHLIR
ncbi:RsmB/NOP family class I SAM-dependent RNA methyltransferase [Marimonas arenosa]|uniref:RsmB/NOP family class I SAM-dependent RNA methyltransferase n=1 Tax=Marimonas arenosa TaxID=1795305 RepID=A0AAE3W8Z7_9RHOB|nr:RsmB/NOP family class I SAM-dependent RNA methyltransferase [Marimonas arenosa]MDQ2088419.1 RsmB/NOP family class I SAM-dependent RNA methyltransferase [Marimonas arenosa]